MKTRRPRSKVSSSSRPRALPRPPRKARPVANREPAPAERSREAALLAARAGLEKKAGAVEIVDVSGKVDYADYLILMTGQNERHVAAIADHVDTLLAENGLHAISVEGLPIANWVLIDFVDIVVHVFQQEARAVYDLDGLWMDARRVPVPGAIEPP